MGNNRKKKGSGALKTIMITVSVLAVLAGAAAAVYFAVFGTVTVVCDNSFGQVVPSGSLTSLRLKLALEGKRLRVVTLQDRYLNSPDLFRARLASEGGPCVILTPVPAAYAVINEVDVSALLPDTVVIGIHDGTGTAFFDVTLVSDELSGWKAVASALQAESGSMARNVALVYENAVDELAQDIVDSFPAGHVTEMRKDGTARMFAIASFNTMDSQGIVLALCPYVTGFASFFSEQHSVMWIVDYRFAPTVPDANLYGVVTPDLGSLPAIIDEASKGSRTAVSLPYVYEKR